MSPREGDQLHRVQSVTDAALAHLTLEGLLDELLIRVRELLSADTAAILLLDPDRQELIATAAKGIEEEVEQGVRLPIGRGFAGTIAARGEPVVLESVDHTKVLNPLLLKRGIKSMLGVPLIVAGSVIGVMHVGTLHPRLFTPDDVALLQLVADRAALAVDARRHQQHRAIAETLHRSLLPQRFPRVEGVEISGLYVPAGGGMVGGDWYDVFSLHGGSLCVVVGDTVGSGLDAAIAMGRLRDSVRALMFVQAEPKRVMTQLNELVAQLEPSLMATAFIGLIDAEGTMTYANAGHLPPLIVDPDGSARLIVDPPEPAVGATFHSYTERTIKVPVSSSLILYSDGLVEKRGRPLDEGMEALRRAAESPWSSVENLCARALGTDSIESALSDDLAALVLRFVPQQSAREVRLTLPADPRELSAVRHAVRRWLFDNRIDREDAADILLAVGEAVANAVEHAYGPGRGSVRLEGKVEGDDVQILVADQGHWREPRGFDRGRGRAMMRAAMDDVVFTSTEQGTTVRMSKRLNRAR